MILIPIAEGQIPQKPKTQKNSHQRYQKYYHMKGKSRKNDQGIGDINHFQSGQTPHGHQVMCPPGHYPEILGELFFEA